MIRANVSLLEKHAAILDYKLLLESGKLHEAAKHDVVVNGKLVIKVAD